MRYTLLGISLLSLAGCGGAPFTVADIEALPDSGDPPADAAAAREVSPVPPEAASDAGEDVGTPAGDSATPDSTPDSTPEAAPIDACDPAAQAVSFACPVGGGSTAVTVPLYYALTDVDQCSYRPTPAACLCAYGSACLKAAGVCNGQSFSGYTAEPSGVVVVTCN